MDVVGFSQFKRYYEAAAEERAQEDSGKISKSQFLDLIYGPFMRAFTPDNIKKGFEKTGTWPIDQKQVTAEMMAPSEGLSGMSMPVVKLNSPVKNTLQLMNAFSALRSQSPPVEAISEYPLPMSQESNLLANSAPPPSSPSIDSLFDGFQGTQAAFLFDGSPPSSANAVPPIDFHLPDQPKLSSASANPMQDWQLAPLTKDHLIDRILKLQHDIELLTVYSESVTQVTRPMGAQLTLLTLENKNLRGGLYLKEERKNRHREVLFPGGRGQEATGDVFMGKQASIEAENAQKNADLARRKADLAKRREKWEVQKAEHEKRKKEFAARGLAMAKAGPPPLLKNVVLDAEVDESAARSDNIGRVQNIPKGKGKQRRDSIDSLLGEIFELDESESDQESGVWSAHDESDE